MAQVDANNNRTEYKYDELGRRTDVTKGAKSTIASTSKTEYDKVGNVTAEIDGNTNKTQYVYDARNRQTSVIDALNPSGTTTTEYDDVGNVTSIKDPVNNTTQFVYDARNWLKSETNQLNKTRSFEYDKVGNRTQITDRNNRTRSFTYDALNRETAENWLNATNTPIRTITSTYDAASQLTSVKDPDSTYQFSYDPKGRQIGVDNTGTPGVPNVLLNYTYDDEDNLLSVKDTINGAAKGNTAYSYDTLNRVSRITQSGNGVASKRVDFGYDDIGQIKSVNRYSDLSGSQLVRGTTYTYDAKNRLDILSHGSGVSYDFDYDNGNRITKITDVDGVTNYTYDKNNQLTVANHSNSNKPDEGFSYDANGNRNSSGYQTGTNNRLNSDGKYNYAYDDEGNLIRRTEISSNKVTEYEWDYRNRLAGVVDKNVAGNVTQEVGFKYDSQNRRISKKVGNAETRFVYDRDNVLFDFTASGSNQPVLDQRYFYGTGVDQILAQESANGSVLWALSDQLGTVKDWVNNGGSVANHVVYGSFGQVVSQSNPAFGSRYGFTGREFDAETGLSYYRSRYYSPGIGRFIGEDAIGFGAGDANLYRYVGNRPVDNVDPFGLVVKGLFDRRSGILTLKDLDTGETVTVQAYSGTGDAINRPNRENDKNKGPIPAGRYDILAGPDKEFYRLDAIDSWRRNDRHEPTGREEFRLHIPGASIGCIAVGSPENRLLPKDQRNFEEWKRVANLLEKTRTVILVDNLRKRSALGVLSNFIPGIKYYGEIEVR